MATDETKLYFAEREEQAVIDYINSKPIEELKTIYEEMHEILDHNYQHTLNLKKHIIRFHNNF
jgi:hypothetical protein